MSDSGWITGEDWEVIVSNVPIVSVDPIVLCDGGVLLGKRENKPAKGKWFVPGGRVHKGEALVDAVQRVAEKELGTAVQIEASLGAYEYFYDTADVDGADGKHYVANGYVVIMEDETYSGDSQHEEFR